MFGFLSRRKVDPRKQLSALMGDYALPSFPGVVLQALEEMRKESGSASSVAQVISRDPGTSIRLLKLVNSASFGSARKIESVQQAVSMLGMSHVESLVLSIGVRTALPNWEAPGFETQRFWRTAARRAEVASGFAALLHPASRHLSFTAALLADMAVPLLTACPTITYSPLLIQWHGGGSSLEELEQEALGCHHGDVATWLCNEWELPEALAEAIGGHHGAEDLRCPPAVSLAGLLRETDNHTGIDELVALGEDHGIATAASVAVVHEGFARGDALAGLFA